MNTTTLSLRPAVEDDCEMLHAWVNDPVVRAASFSTAPIAWDEHCRWFARRLDDPRCMIFIVAAPDGEPVGQVRFEVDEHRVAIVSTSIAEPFRGRGHGPEAIRLAARRAMRGGDVDEIHAFIRPENTASVRAFTHAGFEGPESVDYHGTGALRMVFRDVGDPATRTGRGR